LTVIEMRRRAFIAILGAAVVGWSRAARARQPERVHRVGALFPFSENDPVAQPLVAAFSQALGRLGWIEGKNVRLDYRFAANNPALFSTYAAELVGLSPDVILANTPPAALPLQHQTRAIPIVFYSCSIPSGWAWFRASRSPAAT
jgi:putative ABC transport system substrate-binding protein